ncbi:lipoate--protein ligase [Spiroplasma sp. AdecLV25b]|uniref:lipoate--protein ligase n=1 Tax=Spiroplasma sp. AdecLV25b TaxID=3027162 RepID=UPI0027E1DDC0|nr:lipoate--protein ligase [Spiroplasma sp. AdecLV25b]
MIYYINDSKDPYFNLATEEYLISNPNITDEILLLWQNNNTIVIGRNQNTIEEINNEYVREKQVNVVRRLSGGGAVYQDLGNLNFTFIFNKNQDNARNYALFTKPIIEVLQSLGLNAQNSGKNDIVINDKKISGNAQYTFNNRILHHGTILFNVDMQMLPKVLKPDLEKLQSKGIKSVQARVTNILPLLKTPLTIDQFQQLIVEKLQHTKNTKVLKLTPEMISEIETLATKKYRTWDWNYGKSPTFDLKHKTLFPNKGTIHVWLNVQAGIINNIKIYGDFLGSAGTDELEQNLIHQKYNVPTITNIVKSIDITAIFGQNFIEEDIISSIIK